MMEYGCPHAAVESMIRRQVRVFGLAGLLGASVFTASLIVLHLTRADVDWTRHYVSDFANGRLGWVFVLGIVVHALGNLALNLGLRRSLDPGPLRAWAVFFFGLAVAGIVVAALFPIDPAGRSPSPAGLVHRVATIATFPLELVALFLFSAAFARTPHWKQRQRLSFALAAVAAAGMAGFFLAFFLNRLPGLAERFVLASFLAWEFWAAVQLARPASYGEVVR